MPFDGLVTTSVVKELHTIIPAKVDKIYQPNKYTIVLGLYSNGINYNLNICADANNPRLHLTWHDRQNPSIAPNFCMLLRKYLSGAKLISASTSDLERVINLSFECYNEYSDKTTKNLFVEIMGRYSNIVLTNEDGTIVDSLKHVNSSRKILPKLEYSFPPSDKIRLVTKDLLKPIKVSSIFFPRTI